MLDDGGENMQFVGVDGCKKGWFAVALGSDREWAIGVFKTIDDLWNTVNSALLMFIDIPIGLPDSSRRVCDQETRKLLKQRGASVFPVPCRNALRAKNYRQACRLNQAVLGVKLSIQTWNITAKIKEIDNWLQCHRKAQPHVRESHPELCFWALAGKRIMAHSKKTALGFAERFAVLQKSYAQAGVVVEQAMTQFRRRDLARDDILDALVLAVSGRISAGKPKTIPLSPSLDKMGRPMEIVYPPAQFI